LTPNPGLALRFVSSLARIPATSCKYTRLVWCWFITVFWAWSKQSTPASTFDENTQITKSIKRLLEDLA
jgi:hypothetical protein